MKTIQDILDEHGWMRAEVGYSDAGDDEIGWVDIPKAEYGSIKGEVKFTCSTLIVVSAASGARIEIYKLR